MWKILEIILESPAQGLLREERQGGGSKRRVYMGSPQMAIWVGKTPGKSRENHEEVVMNHEIKGSIVVLP